MTECIAIFLVARLVFLSPQDSTTQILFWNLENFFDWRNDGTSASDAEFSSWGPRRWTRKRFKAKCQAIAKAILWAGTQKGSLPDIIGIAEIENAFVLQRLIQTTALRKLDYGIIHFDSPDSRDIDVALLYRKSRMKLVDAKPCHLYDRDSSVMATRDILLARFKRPGKEDVAFLVNHHPSKYGGTDVSEPRRRQAVMRLRYLADSLLSAGVRCIVAMGDFNDTPANPVYRMLEPSFDNVSDVLFRQGKGSIKYDGAWELIDLFFVTPECCPSKTDVLLIPFLQTPDKAHAGTKPLRTYSGPRYLGGVSDHCPIWLEII